MDSAKVALAWRRCPSINSKIEVLRSIKNDIDQLNTFILKFEMWWIEKY